MDCFRIIEQIESFGRTINESEMEYLERCSQHADWEVRNAVAENLIRYVSPQSEKLLLKLCNDKEELVRVNACDSLSGYSSVAVIKTLERKAKNDTYLVRGYAVLSLGDIAFRGRQKEITLFLENNLNKEKSTWVRINYYYTLCLLGKTEYFCELTNQLENRYYRNRYLALESIYGLLQQPLAIDPKEYAKTKIAIERIIKSDSSIAVKNKAAELWTFLDHE